MRRQLPRPPRPAADAAAPAEARSRTSRAESAAEAAPAAAAATPDKGDTAWMLTSTALVLLMSVPALALFYGGLVRSKNMLSVLMQVFVVLLADHRAVVRVRLLARVHRGQRLLRRH